MSGRSGAMSSSARSSSTLSSQACIAAVDKTKVAHVVLVQSFLSFAQFGVLGVLVHSFLSFAQF